MNISPSCNAGYRLLHEGVIALSHIESNGMRVDVDYLDRTIEEVTAKIKSLGPELRESKVGRLWQKRHGVNTNFDSREQLAGILFDKVKDGGMGYESVEETDSGLPSTEESALEKLNSRFVEGYLKLQKLIKARSTYLLGIRREVVGDRIHPVFNLHTAMTYRSSSDTPNFQNFPVRNPEIAKLIRTAFIASPGHVIVENDFKGIEVTVATCYHKDPVMLSYIQDETKDMHRDMAMQLYRLKQKEVHKNARYGAKNMFVFPEFYGSFYAQCAPNLWEWADRAKIPGPEGMTLRQHLDREFPNGLGACDLETRPMPSPKAGTFEKHVQQVEADFWNKRFMVYGKWKKKWYEEYLEEGGFDTLTGFRINGVMKRNEVINYPVQGSAFHCLLWSLTPIIREMRRRKMRSKIVGQIHDSIVADIYIPELDEYLSIVKQVTEIEIRKYYTWLIAPLKIEVEIAPEGMTWYDKREVKITADGYNWNDGEYRGDARGLIKYWNDQRKKEHGNN